MNDEWWMMDNNNIYCMCIILMMMKDYYDWLRKMKGQHNRWSGSEIEDGAVAK